MSPDKKAASEYHEKIAKEIQWGRMHIYTDGSGIDEQIGAAAYNKTLNQTSHQHLGCQTKYNVYAAELAAIQVGISQWARIRGLYPVCYIYTDSQAACMSIAKPRRQSGQSIIRNILDQIDEVGPRQQLNIVWIPGHQGVEGNERADKEAKTAAQSPEVSQRTRYPPQKSCSAQDIKAKAKVQWQKTWEAGATARHLRRILAREGAEAGPKLYNEIPNRESASTLVQLRTGHCRLNKYLYRMGKKDSAMYECEQGEETVEHYLLECPKYREQRRELRKEVGIEKMNVAGLLGGHKIYQHTRKYVGETGRTAG